METLTGREPAHPVLVEVHGTPAEQEGRAAGALAEGALRVKVATVEEEQTVAEYLDRIADVRKKAEAARTFLVKPLNEHVRAINDRFKAALAPLDRAEEHLCSEAKAFRRREQEREAAERKAREDAERKAADEAKALVDSGVPAETARHFVEEPPPVPVPAVTGVTRSATGSGLTTKKVPRYRVVSAKKVPDEYKVVVESLVVGAIRAKVDKAATEESPATDVIPGIAAWWEDEIARVGRR